MNRDVFIFSDRKGIHKILCDEITFFEGNGRCCVMHTLNDAPRNISQNLGWVMLQLADKGFVKIHRSYIINKESVRSYLTEDGGTALMKNDMKVPVARDKRALVKSSVKQA